MYMLHLPDIVPKVRTAAVFILVILQKVQFCTENLYRYLYELHNRVTILVKFLDNYRPQIDRTTFVLLLCVPEIYALPYKIS
jgi:uncharacterized Fe-S radical SAM superfamily protein PflX